MTTPIFSSLTVVAIQAALKAGDILKRGFGTTYEILTKPGRQNFVTEFDKSSEASIISMIRDHFPSHSFLAEESGFSENSNEEKILWIIDPLDGTTNFAHHIPVFTISIAAYQHEKGLCGVVFQPMTQELFIAERGKGAFLNGMKLKVSHTKLVEDSLMIASLPYNINSPPLFGLERFTQLIEEGVTLRNLGSAALALAYIAAGKVDSLWMYNLYPWDVAAGQLLLEEAGGMLSSYPVDNHPHSASHILASNKLLHPLLQNILFSKSS